MAQVITNYYILMELQRVFNSFSYYVHLYGKDAKGTIVDALSR